MGESKAPLGQATVSARQAPRLNKVLGEGQDQWNEAEFEEYLHNDYLENKNRSVPALGCIEKKGGDVVSSGCSFECYLECSALTMTHRLRGLQTNFKEGLLTPDEAKHMYALMRVTQDSIKKLMGRRITGMSAEDRKNAPGMPEFSGLVDDKGVRLLSVLKKDAEEVEKIGAELGVTSEDIKKAEEARDKGSLTDEAADAATVLSHEKA